MRSRQETQLARRSRILNAARTAFGQQGYVATTTRGIAARAGVSESLLFRYFGTKEDLFEQAVLTPFTELVSRQVADWARREPGSLSPMQETTRIYTQLVELFLIERPVIVALLAVYHYDDATPAVTRKLEQAMRELIGMYEERALAEVEARGNESVDVPTFVRLMVGMAFAVTALPNLFSIGRTPPGRLIDEMALMTIYGTRFRHLYQREELFRGVGLGIDVERLERELVPLTPAPPEPAAPSLVTDEIWARVAPELAPRATTPTRGRRRTDDRTTLSGILHVLTLDQTWGSITSASHGVSGVTCWRRLREWQADGTWHAILPELRRTGLHVEIEVHSETS